MNRKTIREHLQAIYEAELALSEVFQRSADDAFRNGQFKAALAWSRKEEQSRYILILNRDRLQSFPRSEPTTAAGGFADEFFND